MAVIAGRSGGAAPTEVVLFLLRLYPAPWRARYGEEFVELLETRPPNLRDGLDIVVGAVDARINPQMPGAPDRQVRMPGDRSIRGLAVLAGALFTVWGVIGASVMRPWNSGLWPTDPTLTSIAYLAGLVGAFTATVALILVALRYGPAIGDSASGGALLTALGMVLSAFGAGVPGLLILGVGTGMLAWRARGGLVDTPTALVFAAATFVVIAGSIAFVAGGGQDVRIAWALAGYGPAWMLFGLRMRAPLPPQFATA